MQEEGMKYCMVEKDDMLLPKKFLVALLKDWHDQFYGTGDVPGTGSEYDQGVAEGFKRMTMFIESLEVKPV